MQEEWEVLLSVGECVNPVIEKWLWNAYLQQFVWPNVTEDKQHKCAGSYLFVFVVWTSWEMICWWILGF